ncbi:hypothetical protein [Neisseria sp. Ec49-e6-T10]|uniref:hypothetical protein n=1 Tax=Neisseria sp. Ec49-e6-T10 TaxID=3140744 RepID=UPI003EBD885D
MKKLILFPLLFLSFAHAEIIQMKVTSTIDENVSSCLNQTNQEEIMQDSISKDTKKTETISIFNN